MFHLLLSHTLNHWLSLLTCLSASVLATAEDAGVMFTGRPYVQAKTPEQSRGFSSNFAQMSDSAMNRLDVGGEATFVMDALRDTFKNIGTNLH